MKSAVPIGNRCGKRIPSELESFKTATGPDVVSKTTTRAEGVSEAHPDRQTLIRETHSNSHVKKNERRKERNIPSQKNPGNRKTDNDTEMRNHGYLSFEKADEIKSKLDGQPEDGKKT